MSASLVNTGKSMGADHLVQTVFNETCIAENVHSEGRPCAEQYNNHRTSAQ